ncbi:phage integrase SAM-like domain-containing protein [Chryseobacterium viscerum]|uniref:Site-specific integrase n=1 Tax=Chryseobacterium viscerum TaxID=1037377 RepID=A0A5N4BU58_9FLAO|nr:phage integrase SAM-like domain-containing protein [Chryseobacterium viscerum]KAB1231978.1 site-specific integrase [Chryseobacterium viscerum]
MTLQFFLSENCGTQKNIHLVITENQQNKKYNFRTNLSISEENWDKEKQRPCNIYIKKYKILNTKLDCIKKKITGYIDNKKILRREISCKIKNIGNGVQDPPQENTLLYYMQWYIDSKKDLICHSTYKRYKVFFRLMERFEGFLCKSVYIENVDSDFIRDFMVFGKKEEYSENTIYRTIHFIKTILNFVERKGIRTCVRELELRREKQKKEVVTLTEKEIIKIQKTVVPKELQAAKDWLLISCYTGQRFSDFIRFNTQQLHSIEGKTCLSFEQQKTKKEIFLPLHPKVLHIIEQNENRFPKIMDIQHYNKYIKEIAKLAHLNESLKSRKRIGYRSKEVQTEKWETLSSHIGRRSFATNFYGKIPTPLLMEATGHSTEQMFLRYINPVNKDRILSLGNYFDKIDEGKMAYQY